MEAQLQQLSEEFNQLQKDLQSTVQSLQKLEAQKQENVDVQKEFEKLNDDNIIYKLVGPVLLKQEKSDAEAIVKGRLDFIGKEITRVEAQIQDLQSKIGAKKGEIIKVQTSALQGAKEVAAA